MFTRIDHVEILPSDFDRSIAFYQDVLEFRLVSQCHLAELLLHPQMVGEVSIL